MKALVQRLLRKGESPESPAVRARLGTIGSGVGVGVNVLLAAMKLLVGVFTGSVAVMADAVNNLSDAGGSLVSLVTMRLAQKPVDREHPFGHGRLEYIGALAVGVLILAMGLELLKSSVDSILHPAALAFSWVMFAVLLASIVLKALLFVFYRAIGQTINGASLLAAARDSLSDCMATGAVALSMLLGHLTGWIIDGWMGLLVAMLVFKAGFDVCRDMLDNLMGGRPDPELGRSIIALLGRYEQILGVHDLIVHDYGPGRCIASVHAEVPADGDLLQLHEMIDDAEMTIGRELNIPICIHMDPVVTGDPETDAAARHLADFLKTLDPAFMLHDLRRVPGEQRINLVFDVVIPAGYQQTDILEEKIQEAACALDPRYRCVIHFDIDYFGVQELQHD